MSMIQIRNVPPDIHRELKVKARSSGMTLSDFLLREVSHVAGRLTPEQLRSRIESRQPVAQGFDFAAVVREERDAR